MRADTRRKLEAELAKLAKSTDPRVLKMLAALRAQGFQVEASHAERR